MTLARYLARLFVVRFVFILAMFVVLLQMLELLDNAGAALQRGGMRALLIYAALRMPSVIDQAVPISVLLAALVTFLHLAQTNEIVAMRTCGVTVYRMVATLAVVASVIAAAHFLLGDQIAPRSERMFKDWWMGGDAESTRTAEARIWFRDGDSIIGVDRIEDAGALLQGVQLFVRDAEGNLTAQIVAERAEFAGGRWSLSVVRQTSLGPTGAITEAISVLAWPTELTPANFIELSNPTERLSIGRLRDILSGRWSGLRSKAFYQARLHRKFAFPAASLIMVLLAAPAAFGTRRSGHPAYRVALGLAVGFLYLFADAFLLAVGQAGLLAPGLAVWTPVLFFGVAGGAVLVHLEG